MTNVKKLNAVSFLSGMLFYTPIMTLFLLEHGINLGFLIAAQTAFSIAMMLGELPTGVLADKYGQKVSIRLGLLLDAFGMLQLLFVRGPISLILFFLVRGVSVAFRSGSDEALLYDSYKAENKSTIGYSKAFGHFLANDVLGFIVGTALAGVGVALFGQSSYAPLIILSGLATLMAIAVSYTLKTTKHVAKNRNEFNSLSHLKSSLKLVKSNRTIYALAIAGLLTLNGEYFLRQSYQPYFEDMAVPALFLGVALSAGKLLNFFVIRYSHLLEKYLTVDQIIFWINALLGLGFIVFSLVGSPWAIVAIFILIQGLLNAERPVVSDYVNQNVESHQRSTVLSAVSLTQNFGQIIARIALGVSVGLIGVGKTYVVQGTYMVIGAIIAAWYLRRCGCVHRVKHNDEMPAEALIEEPV